jgi:putative phage-type endonuclease
MSITEQPIEVQQLTPFDRWIQDRRTGIGASEWAIVLGISAYKSRYELAVEKIGTVAPDDLSDNEDIEYGHAMERVTLEFLAKRTKREIKPWDSFTIVRGNERPHLFCTPDALQTAEGKPGEGTAQAKNTNAWFAKEWKTEPPLIYQIQLQGEMAVMGLKWGTLCVTIGGNRFRYFDIERNDKFIDAALPLIDKFWAAIQAGELPEVDASESARNALAKLYPEDNGKTVALIGKYQQFYLELSAIKAAQKKLETRRDFIENHVKAAIADNLEAMLPNGSRFSWKPQTRTCICKHCKMITSESTFRVLRQHDAKGGYIEAGQQRVALATSALLSKGATLIDESESGSRYFEMAGGLTIRLADHPANDATSRWMDRKEVFEIRIDSNEWQEQLNVIVANAPDAEDE